MITKELNVYKEERKMSNLLEKSYRGRGMGWKMSIVHNVPFLSSISPFRDHLQIPSTENKHPLPVIHCITTLKSRSVQISVCFISIAHHTVLRKFILERPWISQAPETYLGFSNLAHTRERPVFMPGHWFSSWKLTWILGETCLIRMLLFSWGLGPFCINLTS